MATSGAPSKVVLAIERKSAAADLLGHIARDGVDDLTRNDHFMLALVQSTTVPVPTRLCLLGLENAHGRVRANILYAFSASALGDLDLSGPHHVLNIRLKFEDVPLGKIFVTLDERAYSELSATSKRLRQQVVYIYEIPESAHTHPPITPLITDTMIDTTIPIANPHAQQPPPL